MVKRPAHRFGLLQTSALTLVALAGLGSTAASAEAAAGQDVAQADEQVASPVGETPLLEADHDEVVDDGHVIVVTARKREEALLDIPDSITALSEEFIERGNITGLQDIGEVVPNLSLSVRTDGFANVSIRGVGSFGNTQGVGFYLDDSQLFADASSRFGDLERIEVLRGPQGTLYGGSNIGGAVRFISVRPSANEFSGDVKLVAGEQNLRDLEAAVNVPLGPDWAVRLFGFTASNDGYLVNTNPPRVNGGVGTSDRDIGRVEESGVRASVFGRITNNLSLFGSVRWNDLDAPNNLWAVETDNDFEYSRERNFSFSPRLTRETLAGSVNLELDQGPFVLNSITSYTDTDYEENMDLDSSSEFILALNRPKKMEVFTQEFRITSVSGGPFEWLAGLHYLDSEEDTDATLLLYESGDVLFAGGIPTAAQESNVTGVPFEDRFRDREQYAAFATASYRLGAFEIGGGIRLDRWKVYTINRDSGVEGTQSKTEFLPRLSLSYFINDDQHLYATFSEGFEPGGFNLTNFGGVNELFGYGAERTTNYELGYKARFGRSLIFTSAVFLIDYTDRQFELQTTDPSGQIVEGILNAGDSRQYGAEFDVTWFVDEFLTLTAGGGFVEAEWKEGTILPDGRDISGLRPPYMKDSSLVLAADYDRPISPDWNIMGRVQLSYNGAFQTDLGNEFHNPAYTLVNLRAGLARDNLEFAVNVENLFDEDHYTDTTLFPNFNPFIPQPSIVIGTLGQPRMVTASVRVKF